MKDLLTLLALAACAPQQSREPPVTFERREIRVGGTPYALVAVDVTGDARLDLVVADQTGGRLVVLAGDGAGGFADEGEVAAGPSPGGVAAADFDEDGNVDLAVANHETDHLTMLRGLGGGSFDTEAWSPLTLGVSPHVHVVVSADLNEDGHADLVVDHRDAGGLRAFLGTGDGSFGEGTTIDMEGDPYRGFLVVDLDGDGHLDLASPNELEAGIRLGKGDASFGPRRNVRVAPLAPFAIAAADVDGDGNLDLGLGSGEGGDDAIVLRGDGSGGFEPYSEGPWPVGPGAKSMTGADLDGDGTGDLVVASWHSTRLTVLLGGPGGMRSLRVEAGENPWGVAAADLDADGRPDLATANYGNGTVTILLTRPD